MVNDNQLDQSSPEQASLPHPHMQTVGDVPLGLGWGSEPDWDQVGDLYDLIIRGPNRQTIAVTGDWGSGKTSLMRLVQKRIDQSMVYPTIWFNVWRYERETDLVVPLLQTIEHDLRNAKWLGESNLSRAREGLRRLSLGFLRGISLRYGPIGIFEGDKFADFFESQDGDEPEASRYFGFVTRLEELIESLRENDPQFRIVIFVDDLDRCQYEAMFRLMESMKLFFDIPGVVFVTGVATAPLRQAVAKHYDEEVDSSRVTRADLYVDKVFPQQFKVVVSAADAIERYAHETGCNILSDSAYDKAIYALRVRRLLGVILGDFGIETPRATLMWLDPIDRLLHRFVDWRYDDLEGDEKETWTAIFGSAINGCAAEGLVFLVMAVRRISISDALGHLSEIADLNSVTILNKLPEGFGSRAVGYFGYLYRSFGQPTTLELSELNLDDAPGVPPIRLIRPA